MISSRPVSVFFEASSGQKNPTCQQTRVYETPSHDTVWCIANIRWSAASWNWIPILQFSSVNQLGLNPVTRTTNQGEKKRIAQWLASRAQAKTPEIPSKEDSSLAGKCIASWKQTSIQTLATAGQRRSDLTCNSTRRLANCWDTKSLKIGVYAILTSHANSLRFLSVNQPTWTGQHFLVCCWHYHL